MRNQNRLPPPAAFLGGCTSRLLFVLTGLGGLTLLFALLTYAWAWQMKSVVPQSWDKSVADLTGLKSEKAASVDKTATEPELNLTEDEKARLTKVGKDPALVLRALQTEKKCIDKLGDPDKCSAALYVTLTNGESANCTNAGRAPALREMRSRGFTSNVTDFMTLFEIWKRNDIRNNPGSHAADNNPDGVPYIPPDYDPEKVMGSVGAGAVGCSQFMPSTAKIHLAEIGEPFDLWHPDTAMMLMAMETARLGYRKSNNAAANIQAMMGWNQDRTWINSIVNGAASLAASIGNVKDLADTQTAINTAVPRVGSSSSGESVTDWQDGLLAFLNFLGLGPSKDYVQEVQAVEATKDTSEGGTIAAATSSDGSWQLPLATPVQTSTCQDHIDRGSPCAWDLASFGGDSIRPTRDGKVIFAACGWNGGYGCRVGVDHGDGFTTYYSHMQDGSIKVKVGDSVTKATVLGKEGSTGNSTGAHVDFVIQKGGVAIDPDTIFGSFSKAMQTARQDRKVEGIK